MSAAALASLPAGVAGATTPPPPDGADTTFLRAQAEQAAGDYFTAGVPGGVTQIACAPPPADVGGVQFLCYAVDAGGDVVVASATVNDYGVPELSPVDGSLIASTAAPTPADDPTIQTVEGSGNQTVAVDQIVSPTLVAVSAAAGAPFTLQPEQAGAPVGPAVVDTVGPLAGRYLVGVAGPFSSFHVTAEGNWTITLQRLTSALPLAGGAPAAGQQPDVVSYTDPAAVPVTISYEGTGPIRVTAVTGAGAEVLVDQPGPYTGALDAPAGPGFLAVDATGPWTISPVSAPTTTPTTVPVSDVVPTTVAAAPPSTVAEPTTTASSSATTTTT